MAPVVFVQREKERKKEAKKDREKEQASVQNNVDEVIIWKNKTRTRIPLKCFLSKSYL